MKTHLNLHKSQGQYLRYNELSPFVKQENKYRWVFNERDMEVDGIDRVEEA